MMIKKITLLSACLSIAFCATGVAKPGKLGDFNDLYQVVSAHPVTLLSSSVVSGPVSVQPTGNNGSFVIIEQGHPAGPGGIVNTVIGTDTAHSCSLTIQDVDFSVPVLVSQSCVGGYSLASFNAGYNNVTITINN